MASARLSHALLFAKDQDRLVGFYSRALGLRSRPTKSPEYVELLRDGEVAVSVHAVPRDIADSIAIDSPAKRREDVAIKPCFFAEDLDAVRAAILEHGGQAQEPWLWAHKRFCECADPEGNVFQIWSGAEPADVLGDVRHEVEALHEFFVAWFSGVADPGVFAKQFEERFAPEFTLVPPSGAMQSLSSLGEAIKRGHGTNPPFKIAIRNVEVRLAQPGFVVATYEEWQRNAKASTPQDNGRLATVLFRRDDAGSLKWCHIHETWLPADQMSAGPYDF